MERPKERRAEERWGSGGKPMVRPRNRPPWAERERERGDMCMFDVVDGRNARRLTQVGRAER